MKKSLLIIAGILLIALSCGKIDNNSVAKEAKLSVKAGINILNSTKAVKSGESFINGDKIGVQVRNEAGNALYAVNSSANVPYEMIEGSWSGEFYLSSTIGKVYGYYPYDNTIGAVDLFSQIAISIPVSSTEAGVTDYMYSTPVEVSSISSSANLSMNHSLTQISFYVYKENYLGAGVMSSFKIEDAAETSHILTDGVIPLNMSILNGSLSGGQKGSVTRTLNKTLTATTPSVNVNDLRTQVNASTLLIPANGIESDDIKFTFSIDGIDYTANNSTAVNWEKAKQYIYKIKLTGSGMSITGVTITDWSPVEADQIVIN